MHTTNPTAAASAGASARAWRAEASALRALATGSHLQQHQRQTLLREAIAADRQAEWWRAGSPET